MSNENFETPVLFMIFNRPDVTKRVFSVIGKVKPKRLYVTADGARKSIPGEYEKCCQTRAIINDIDWDCDLKTLYHEKNLGCRIAVSRAISWFFEQVEEGIILEDDCLPDISFFHFCRDILEHYRDDKRIMHITGDNFQFGEKRGDASYYFAKSVNVWGWGTWKRAWSLYDVDMKTFPEFLRLNCIKNIWEDVKTQNFWLDCFKKVYENAIDTWDFQWVYTVWSNNGLSVIPNSNLVSNIGFGSEATHTVENNKFSDLELSHIKTIIHPKLVIPDLDADKFIFSQLNITHQNILSSMLIRVKDTILKLLKKIDA